VASMRTGQRILATLVLIGLMAFGVGFAVSQTGDTPPAATTTDDDDGEVRGQADTGPAMGALVVGLLCIAMVALLFAAYMRHRP
jgi:hypothetical protein